MIRTRLIATSVLCALLFGAAIPSLADEVSEVKRLTSEGQTAEAQMKLDQFLALKPNDPQLRFLKGVMLTEANLVAEAIPVFVKITEDYPELAEPYNNLAVLYAAQGEYDKARSALESAVRANPGYATGHENLGDVYAKLATREYARALQLDPNNLAVPAKLAAARELFVPKLSGSRPGARPLKPVSP